MGRQKLEPTQPCVKTCLDCLPKATYHTRSHLRLTCDGNEFCSWTKGLLLGLGRLGTFLLLRGNSRVFHSAHRSTVTIHGPPYPQLHHKKKRVRGHPCPAACNQCSLSLTSASNHFNSKFWITPIECIGKCYPEATSICF